MPKTPIEMILTITYIHKNCIQRNKTKTT